MKNVYIQPRGYTKRHLQHWFRAHRHIESIVIIIHKENIVIIIEYLLLATFDST